MKALILMAMSMMIASCGTLNKEPSSDKMYLTIQDEYIPVK